MPSKPYAPPVAVSSTIVKKLAPGLFRYFFAFTNPTDQSLDTAVQLRIYPVGFRLLGRWVTFRLTLPPYGSGSGSIDCPYLFARPRFEVKFSDGQTSRNPVADSREDLTQLLTQ